MSLRFSSLDAMKAALGKNIRVHDSFAASIGVHDTLRSKAAEAGTQQSKPKRISRGGVTPHDMLWEALKAVRPDAVREMVDAVPGRKYRLDIAIPSARLAIEVDGWEWHGKHKGDFQRDRERQNLLTLHGWRILRFTAGQIRGNLDECVQTISLATKFRADRESI